MKTFRKLNSRKGVSILLALLILLMCAFAGAGALTMAAANIGRYAYSSEDQQAYYSVTSAAVYVRSAMDGVVYTSRGIDYNYLHQWGYDSSAYDHYSTETYTLKYGSAPATIGIPAADGTVTAPAFLSGGLGGAIAFQLDRIVPFRSIPADWYQKVSAYGGTADSDITERPASIETFTHKFTIASSDLSIGVVEGTLIIYDGYDLVFTFGYLSPTGAKLSSVTLYMTATTRLLTTTDVKSDPDAGYESDTTTRRVEVTWSAAESAISPGEAVTGGGV